MPKRFFIYTKDVQLITGKSDRTARKILSLIRLQFGKARHQPVTVTEFSCYMGMEEEIVERFL